MAETVSRDAVLARLAEMRERYNEIISEMMSQSGITQEVVTGADQRVEKHFVSDSQSDEEALTEPVYGIQAAQADDVTQFIEKITGD